MFEFLHKLKKLINVQDTQPKPASLEMDDAGKKERLTLQLQEQIQGKWHLNYLDTHLETIPLNGVYNLLADDVHKINLFLEQRKEYRNRNDFEHLIAHKIEKIITKHNIPSHDIINEQERFSVFLRDKLGLALKKMGLKLVHFEVAINQHDDTFGADAVSASQPVSSNDEIAPFPPLPSHKDYYRVKQGRQIGPFSAQELQSAIDNGELAAGDLIWQKGMASWEPAHSFGILHFPDK